jgi:hypothetical protein
MRSGWLAWTAFDFLTPFLTPLDLRRLFAYTQGVRWRAEGLTKLFLI